MMMMICRAADQAVGSYIRFIGQGIAQVVVRSALLMLLIGVLGGCGETPEPPPRRNVIVLLSDTHRYDHVSVMNGEAKGLTPNIDELGRDGLCFTRCYTPIPISAPAYASLFSGLTPSEHGLLNNQQSLDVSNTLLAECFKEAGYQTAAVVSNPFCDSRYGFARGFDYFWEDVEGRGKEGARVASAAIEWLEKQRSDRPFFLFVALMDAHTPFIFEGLEPCLRIRVNDEPPRDMVPENVHVINRLPLSLEPGDNRILFQSLQDGQPAQPPGDRSTLQLCTIGFEQEDIQFKLARGFFPDENDMHCFANEAEISVHNPHRERRQVTLNFRALRYYSRANHKVFYREGARSADQAVGQLLGALRRLGLYDDAAIVFLSDHGEMLGEHDEWGHIHTLYEDDVHVPLIIKWPGLTGGARSDRLLAIQDLYTLIPQLRHDPLATAARDWPFTDPPKTAGTVPLMTFPPEAQQTLFGVIRDRSAMPIKVSSNVTI
jgi:arylsulfatase A-like enzyme